MLKQLRKAEDALDRVDPRARLDLGDLYAAGGALTMLTGYLADAVRLGIRSSVEELGDEPVYDDAGGDPYARLAEAVQYVEEFHRLLVQARVAASRYHSAIGHIGMDGGAGDE